jgi:hypothetical protein
MQNQKMNQVKMAYINGCICLHSMIFTVKCYSFRKCCYKLLWKERTAIK